MKGDGRQLEEEAARNASEAREAERRAILADLERRRPACGKCDGWGNPSFGHRADCPHRTPAPEPKP